MKNNYFALRHGESMANVRGIILSDLKNGQLDEYSLSEKGKEQVKMSSQKVKEEGLLDNFTIIVSSPFSRCRMTAEIAHKVLNANDKIIFDERLRERWFGDFEEKNNLHYDYVWEKDKDNPSHENFNVESATNVQKRTSELIEDLEKIYKDQNILLVSHGDVLQILQTWFAGISPSEHRNLPHLEVAEIRKIN